MPSNILNCSVNIGIGDLILLHSQIDHIKGSYDQINININKNLILTHRSGEESYEAFICDLAKLIFSDHPYKLTNADYNLLDKNKYFPIKPNLKKLCNDFPNKIEDDFIVVTTKVRELDKNSFINKSKDFLKTLNILSKIFKIVILGEREVENNNEYSLPILNNKVYGIYNYIISNIDKSKVIDLTIPKLGITSPTVANIQKDCSIMSHSKFTITLGNGGNLALALAVTKVIGYREDNNLMYNNMFNKNYIDAKVTKDWDEFINLLKKECYIKL